MGSDIVSTPVVTGEDDQSVVSQTMSFEGVQHLAKHIVRLDHEIGVKIVQATLSNEVLVHG